MTQKLKNGKCYLYSYVMIEKNVLIVTQLTDKHTNAQSYELSYNK